MRRAELGVSGEAEEIGAHIIRLHHDALYGLVYMLV